MRLERGSCRHRAYQTGNTIFVMVYGPRDEDELEVVWSIFRLSYEFARGGNEKERTGRRPGSARRQDLSLTSS